MKLSDFKFDLPEEFIAQYPIEQREQARLMVLNRKDESINHDHFYNIPEFLNEGDCLVVNETKVFPARLLGTKDKTDAKVEIFLLRELENDLWEVLVKPARKVRVGNRLSIDQQLFCDVIDNRPRQDCFCRTLAISRASSSWLERSAVFPPPDLWFRRDLQAGQKAHSDCLYHCCKFCTGCL